MNKYTATKPKDVNGTFMVTRTAFYRTELMKLVGGIFKIECPADWDKDYMRDTLLRYGYLIVSDTDLECYRCRAHYKDIIISTIRQM